jgi:hypothetical protein
MPLALAAGTVKHVRHGFFFYGDPPAIEGGTKSGKAWTLKCADPAARREYEKLLKAELKSKYNLQDVIVAHVHTLDEMIAAAAQGAGKIWDVVGWVGHAVGGGGLPMALAGVLNESTHIADEKNVIQVDNFANVIKNNFAQAPKELVIVGCSAAEGGFAARLSGRFRDALVLGGSGTNKVEIDFGAHDALAKVILSGDVRRFKDGEEIVDDAVVLRRATEALKYGKSPLDQALLARCHLTITVKDLYVTVKGTVPSDDARDRVTTLAAVPGSTGVTVSATIPGQFDDITGGGAF